MGSKDQGGEFSILVLGAGSIGRRHLANLRALGVKRLAACDPDKQRLRHVASELGVDCFDDLQTALSDWRPVVVFICTPPVYHIEQALAAIRAGAHVFVEKPLSGRIAQDIDELEREANARNCLVQVGYNLRFHPGLQKIKELLDQGMIGEVLWAHAEAGQYLPDWRPWQDYRQSYTARSSLGGGILLDGSHELDYVLWLLGHPAEVLCMAGKVSSLEVDVEDCACVLLRMEHGAIVEIHLDFVQRGYSRHCKIAGEKGTLMWDFSAREVRCFDGGSKEWHSFPYSFEPNEMYLAEVRHFLDCIASGQRPHVGIREAVRVLHLVSAAKESAERSTARSLT
jgi:predicted dehydrogenase